MSDLLLFGLGLLLTVGTGLFVASEFALVNLDRSLLRSRQDAGEKGLGTLIAALGRTSTHLSSAQLGITLTTLLTGYTMEPAVSRMLTGPLVSAGLSADIVRPVASAVAIVLATLLSMLIGELVPKNLALALPEFTGKLVAPFQVAFTAVFNPVVRGLNGFSNSVVRAFGVEPKEELSSARTVEELASLVQHSASEGSLDPRAATLLTRTFDFAEFTAGDVMTPRTRMAAMPSTASVEDLMVLARDTGHSRFPVTGTGVDDVVGVVHVKAALAVPREAREATPLHQLMREPIYVPDTQTVDVLLGELRGGGQLAVVLDEYGGTAGVVTLEDLVEELVGDVADEHDRPIPGVRRWSDDSWTLPGMLRLDEIEERVGLNIPEDENYNTLGGFVMVELERVPQQGDVVEVPEGRLVVVRMDGLRVDRLRFVPSPPAPTEDGTEG